MANICGYIPESINEGLGLRQVYFISGCEHYCPCCYSSHTWDFNAGELFDTKKQLETIKEFIKNPLLDGITICGGDSFYSSKDMIKFIKLFKSKISDLNIWVYTGFTFEEIIDSNNTHMIEYLKMIDVLVDGKYVEELKDLTLRWRGSSNQRLIDVKKSLKQNKIMEVKL